MTKFFKFSWNALVFLALGAVLSLAIHEVQWWSLLLDGAGKTIQFVFWPVLSETVTTTLDSGTLSTVYETSIEGARNARTFWSSVFVITLVLILWSGKRAYKSKA